MKNFESPQILSDLYRDLRDKRLLPLVVVFVVGMAVVPIALSSSPKAAAPAPAPAPVAQTTKAPTEPVELANPGLRNYKKRLAGDSPTDPFIQQFLPSPSSEGSASSDLSGGAGATSTEGAPSGTTTPSAPSGGSTGGSTSQPQTQSRFFFYRAKVRAGKLGENLKVHDSIGSLTPLPNKQVPAATFLGVNTDNAFQAQAAVFLVSSAVSSVDGEGSCSFAGDTCQLLTLKPGEHEDLVWVDGNVYRIELVKFILIARHDPPSTNKKSSGGGDDSSGRSPRKQKQTGSYFSF